MRKEALKQIRNKDCKENWKIITSFFTAIGDFSRSIALTLWVLLIFKRIF